MNSVVAFRYVLHAAEEIRPDDVVCMTVVLVWTCCYLNILETLFRESDRPHLVQILIRLFEIESALVSGYIWEFVCYEDGHKDSQVNKRRKYRRRQRSEA